MPGKYDFERAWLAKFSGCLDKVAGEEIRKTIMEGSEELSTHSNRLEVIEWSKQAMEKLDQLVDENGRRAIMTGCACRYPKSDLQEIRKTYGATGDISLAHGMLQEQFESFLKNDLELEDDLIEEIVGKRWGTAGVLKDDRIIATKIPKSGDLRKYMQETDPQKKRQLYCHCPRVRDVLKGSEIISSTYCYCGAGFYKGIWEEILQRPVEVDLLTSVLRGDDVCTIAVHLPKNCGE